MRPTFNLKTTRNIEKINATNLKRIFLIDLSRAAAVLLMIITHVIAIAFSHRDGSSQIAFFVGSLGGLASFTMFLLLSGATSYVTTINIDAGNNKAIRKRRFKALRRSFQILIAYYLLAALSLFVCLTTAVTGRRNRFSNVNTASTPLRVHGFVMRRLEEFAREMRHGQCCSG